MLIVNREKCIACGICGQICPLRIIGIDRSQTKPVPSIATNMEITCWACGHCEAGCQQGAIKLENDLPGENTALLEELKISPAQIRQHLQGRRRSIRHFKDEPLDITVMKELIDIVRFAPSTGNLQPLHWLIIFDSKQVHSLVALVIDWIKLKLESCVDTLPNHKWYKWYVEAWSKGEDPLCWSAPHLALVHAHKDYQSAPVDAAIALTYLEIAAPVFGVGTCWAGWAKELPHEAVQSEGMQNWLSLPEGHVLLGAMMLGKPRYQYHYIPRRKQASVKWR